MIQTIKDGLRKLDGSLETRLQRLLLSYQTTPHATTGRTPHATTGRTPAELMFGRNLRTRLDLIFPDTSLQVSRTKNLQRQYHDVHTKTLTFEPGDCVYYRDFSGLNPSWRKGKIN